MREEESSIRDRMPFLYSSLNCQKSMDIMWGRSVQVEESWCFIPSTRLVLMRYSLAAPPAGASRYMPVRMVSVSLEKCVVAPIERGSASESHTGGNVMLRAFLVLLHFYRPFFLLPGSYFTILKCYWISLMPTAVRESLGICLFDS